MTREIEKKILQIMLIKHFEKTRPEILGFFTYENISQVVCDLEISAQGIQGCFDTYVNTFKKI